MILIVIIIVSALAILILGVPAVRAALATFRIFRMRKATQQPKQSDKNDPVIAAAKRATIRKVRGKRRGCCWEDKDARHKGREDKGQQADRVHQDEGNNSPSS